MGSSVSSNHIDRRTNALRRSQRKSLTNACSNIDKLMKSINNFSGNDDSEQYKTLKIKIIQIEKNLKSKWNENDVQPQFKTIHRITEEKIKRAHELLDEKVKRNETHEETLNITEPIVKNEVLEIPTPAPPEVVYENTTAQSPTIIGNKRNSLLLRLSKLTSPKNNNNRISSVSSEIIEADIHKSPDDARKSIMKYGVQVLPNPTMPNGGTISRVVSFNTPEIENDNLMANEKRLKIIKQDVANLEIRISEFVGKKDGKHYANLKNALDNLQNELDGIHETELLDQVFLCRNYISSCYNFLDSKAFEDDNLDDDVFTNYTDSKIFGSTHDLLESSVKTTAI